MVELDADSIENDKRGSDCQRRYQIDNSSNSDSDVDEVVESSDPLSEQYPIEEAQLVQGYMLEEASARQEYFEELLQKQQELRNKPIRLYSRSYEAFDEEIESSDRENYESYPQEKPLLYGVQFYKIVEREERENPVDYFVDELDEDADEGDVPEKPLVYGQEFYDIATREDEENPFDYYVDDPNEENEQFETPVEVPLYQHLVFAELEDQERAVKQDKENLSTWQANEVSYQKNTKIADSAAPNAKNQAAGKYNYRKGNPGAKPGSQPTKKDTTFYYSSASHPREDSEVDMEKYYVETQPLGGYVFDVRADNERLMKGIVQTLAEIDEIVAEVRYLVTTDL